MKSPLFWVVVAIYIVLFAIILCSPAQPGQKYNPYSGEFETVPQDYEIKYNPYNQEFTYEAPKAEIEYNPYEQRYDWNPEPDSREDWSKKTK